MRNYPDGVELEDRPCPNGCCSGDLFVIEGGDRLHGVSGWFQVVRCVKCGLMRTNPRPTSNTIAAYYPSDYAPHVNNEVVSTIAKSHFNRVVRRWLGLDARCTPPIPRGRLLEIGCASGSYLEQMRCLGWSVEGIEFSESAAEQARTKGFVVQSATVEAAQAPSEKVDLVAAWMVLEHLHEPVKSLRRIRSWVKPNGFLIASVPDTDAIERRIFGPNWYALQLPTHLYHYNTRSLKAVLAAAGWRLTRVVWQRNCNNLLWSIEYALQDRGWLRGAAAVTWLRTAKSASKVRIGLGWLLGVTRQSGRIEFWGQPINEVKDQGS